MTSGLCDRVSTVCFMDANMIFFGQTEHQRRYVKICSEFVKFQAIDRTCFLLSQ